jgi:hypothetical protein
MANVRLIIGSRSELYAGVVHVDKRLSTIRLTFRGGDIVTVPCPGPVEIDHEGADP